MPGSVTGVMVFMCLVSAGCGGMFAHGRVPAGVFTDETKSIVRRGAWLIAVMAALTLVATTTSLKSGFDNAGRDVRVLAAQVEDLDRTLRRVGPAADGAREMLYRYTARLMKRTWPETGPRLATTDADPDVLMSGLVGQVDAMARAGAPAQAVTEARALLGAMFQTRWSLDEASGRTVSGWQLAVLTFWLMLLFAGIGLLAPRNVVVFGTIGACAIGLAAAVFLMTEFSDPFVGVIIVSGQPLENALHVLSE